MPARPPEAQDGSNHPPPADTCRRHLSKLIAPKMHFRALDAMGSSMVPSSTLRGAW